MDCEKIICWFKKKYINLSWNKIKWYNGDVGLGVIFIGIGGNLLANPTFPIISQTNQYNIIFPHYEELINKINDKWLKQNYK